MVMPYKLLRRAVRSLYLIVNDPSDASVGTRQTGLYWAAQVENPRSYET